MSKLFQALLSGMFFTFILDFFLLLGVKINYIDFYNIDLYYNILFVDHQNFFLFFTFSIFLGYITLYTSSKLSLIVIGILSILVLSTLFSPVGKLVGETLLMHKNINLKTEKFSYFGDIYYEGRKNITFYDHKFKKILTFNKTKIIGEYK